VALLDRRDRAFLPFPTFRRFLLLIVCGFVVVGLVLFVFGLVHLFKGTPELGATQAGLGLCLFLVGLCCVIVGRQGKSKSSQPSDGSDAAGDSGSREE
jgi:hypothetical protein